jgi:hypothetical protein
MGFELVGAKELIADLTVAVEEVMPAVEKVVGQGCNNIKRDAAATIRAASSRGYLPHYPRSISYDVTRTVDTVTGEVGPDAGKLQGGLGRILELGTVNSAPIPHLFPALDAEAPRFERALGDLAVDLLGGGRIRG